MRRSALAFAAAALVLAASAPAWAAPAQRNTLIYKVDSATARVTGRKLTITAQGAVRTGGWENPQLRVKPQRIPETDTLVVEFVATPPPQDAAVIQALLPVSATVTVGLPRYATTKVKVVAETNDVTADIIIKR